MRILIILFLFSLTSCQWLEERAIKNWTGDTIGLLLEMSGRKSMIHDTPLKTMESLESPDGVSMSKRDLCKCGSSLYGGILTVIANDVKESSIKTMCKGMGNCFFKNKAPDFFMKSCSEYIEKGPFKKMARDRQKEIPKFSKARRQLSSYCNEL